MCHREIVCKLCDSIRKWIYYKLFSKWFILFDFDWYWSSACNDTAMLLVTLLFNLDDLYKWGKVWRSSLILLTWAGSVRLEISTYKVECFHKNFEILYEINLIQQNMWKLAKFVDCVRLSVSCNGRIRIRPQLMLISVAKSQVIYFLIHI